MKNYRIKRVAGVLFFVALFAGIAALVMLLWNALIPSIIGWGAVGYWQAAGLLLLSRLLWGGFGGHRHMAGGMFCRKHAGGFHGHMHEHMMDWHGQMHGMSRDERREFIRDRMAGFTRSCDETPGRGNRCEREEGTPRDIHE